MTKVIYSQLYLVWILIVRISVSDQFCSLLYKHGWYISYCIITFYLFLDVHTDSTHMKYTLSDFYDHRHSKQYRKFNTLILCSGEAWNSILVLVLFPAKFLYKVTGYKRNKVIFKSVTFLQKNIAIKS